jgi:hypothetical protein
MTKSLPVTDFRAVRHILEPHDFALGDEEDDPLPSDQIDAEIWAGIMNLPDDVAVRISDHNGTRIRLLYTLWGHWIEAVGAPDRQDELFGCMLDANDCLQCANFDLLHGFYRAAISNLRTALELVMIGTFGNIRPTDAQYLRWKQGDEERMGFSHCRKQLFNIHKGTEIEWLFAKEAFPATIYANLCRFTHARPDASDGALWQSNGPVYNGEAVLKTFKFSLDVYSISHLLVKVGRPDFVLLEDSQILFELDWMTHHCAIVKAHRQLYRGSRR